MDPTDRHDDHTRRPTARGRASERGLSLVEFVLATTIVALALLAHASGSLAGFHLARAEEGRSIALQTVRRFIERLRADQDWGTLHTRLAEKVDPLVVSSDADWPPTAYYDDFETPPELGNLFVRVEVPDSPAAEIGGNPIVLREDVSRPHFGLPYDLNGDGVIDAEPRDGDYRTLPVQVRFRWQVASEPEQTLRVLVWLRGERL